MLIDRRTLSRHLPWIIITLLLLTVAVMDYYLEYRASASHRLPGGSSQAGLLLGILAGVIFVFEFLYWPRRSSLFRRWRVGRSETWLTAHIWLGLLTFPLVLLHSGFQLGGSFTTLFFSIYLLVFCSGICGLILQQIVPKMLLADVPSETIYSQIENVLAQSVADAERILARLRGGKSWDEPDAEHPVTTVQERVIGSPRQVGTLRRKTRSFGDATQEVADIRALEEAWRGEIRPFLESLRHPSARLQNAVRADEYFDELKHRLPATAHPAVEFLREACEKRRQLGRQQWLHFWLHSWLAIHLPLSISLMILFAVHVVTSLRYSVDFFDW